MPPLPQQGQIGYRRGATVLGVGLIGAGGVAKSHIAAWLKQSDAKVVAVADADPNRAAEAAAALGIERWTADYTELLGWDDIEAVDICTTEATHGHIASDAADAGKHVLVEKPIATTLEDTDKIIAAARGAGVQLMVAHTHHFYDYSVSAKAVIDSGEIGDPVYMRFSAGGGFWRQDWTGNRISPGDTGGNVVTNGVHATDLCNWWLGSNPISVYGQAHNVTSSHLEMNDYFMITIKYDNGAIAVLDASRANAPRSSQWNSITVLGTDGEINNAGQRDSQWLHSDDGLRPLGPGFQHGFDREIAAFVSCIQDGTEPPITGEQGRLALEMCLAAEESIRTGQVVPVGGGS
jgi:predicted dehydrogenase